MKLQWFKKHGMLYPPAHPVGYAVTSLAIVLMCPVAMAIFRNGHSVSDDLYQFFVYGTCSAFWWKWVAHKTS